MTALDVLEELVAIADMREQMNQTDSPELHERLFKDIGRRTPKLEAAAREVLAQRQGPEAQPVAIITKETWPLFLLLDDGRYVQADPNRVGVMLLKPVDNGTLLYALPRSTE